MTAGLIAFHLLNSVHFGRKKSHVRALAHYVPTVLLIGAKEGLTNKDAALEWSLDRRWSYNRLMNAVRNGLAYKANQCYFLTDKGQQLYTGVNSEFAPVVNEILAIRAKNIAKRENRKKKPGKGKPK